MNTLKRFKKKEKQHIMNNFPFCPFLAFNIYLLHFCNVSQGRSVIPNFFLSIKGRMNDVIVTFCKVYS